MRADRSGGIGRKGAVMEVATGTDSWRLDERDPLHSHLAQIVLPRAGKAVKHPDFEVGRLSNLRMQVFWQPLVSFGARTQRWAKLRIQEPEHRSRHGFLQIPLPCGSSLKYG
jgi:hypothetical protein